MDSLRKSGFSQKEKDQLVSLLVQLLHSHTLDQDQNFDKFIFKYRQKAGLRKQLSLALQTFVENSYKSINESIDSKVLDTLQVLRSFVEKLYEQRSDTGLDYPNDEIEIVGDYANKFERRFEKSVKMLGGAFVIVDVILAVHRFGDHAKTASFMHSSYRSLKQFISRTVDLKTFLLSSKPFISVTAALLQSRVQFGHELPAAIGQLLLSILCYRPVPSDTIVEKSEIVEPILRTAMGLSYDDHYDILDDLVKPLHNCIAESSVCRDQMCSVDGWANFLLDLLEKLILDKEKIRADEFSFHNHHHFILEVSDSLLFLLDRHSPDEKGRFVELCSTSKVCQVLVVALDDEFYCQFTFPLIKEFIDNRLFVEQLKKCQIAEALLKFRASIKDQQNPRAAPEEIDNILSVLDETAESS